MVAFHFKPILNPEKKGQIMKLFNILICVSVMSMPLLAHADNLKVANRTNNDLSFKINNTCSDRFGVIPADTIKVISEKTFNKECEYNSSYCVAIVYKKANCKGENFAEVGFDTSYGVNYVSNKTSDSVNVIGNGFNLIFSAPLKK